MIVINRSDVPLPAPPEALLTNAEMQRMYRLQARSTLPFYDEKTHQEPLGDEERSELEALELRWNDRRPARCGPIEFRFKPYGEQGCAYDLRYDFATCLLTIHAKRLKVIQEEDLPEGVRPLRLKRYPTNQDMTPNSTEAEGREIAMVLQEGGPNRVRVKESGWAGAAGGPAGGSEGGARVGGGGGVIANVPGTGGQGAVVDFGSDLLEQI